MNNKQYFYDMLRDTLILEDIEYKTLINNRVDTEYILIYEPIVIINEILMSLKIKPKDIIRLDNFKYIITL